MDYIRQLFDLAKLALSKSAPSPTPQAEDYEYRIVETKYDGEMRYTPYYKSSKSKRWYHTGLAGSGFGSTQWYSEAVQACRAHSARVKRWQESEKHRVIHDLGKLP